MRFGVSIAACLLLVHSIGAEDWTQFRGPGGNGISRETGLPVRWSETDNIRWKVDLPGRGLSSPVVANGRVFVTACSGYQQTRLHVLCFDVRNGKQLWERQFWATGNTMCHPKTNMAAPTPVTDGQRVYALFATCDLVCLDRDGNLVWYRSLTGDYPTVTNQVGMAASPLLADDLLILQLENAGESFAAGIDKFTGQNRWKVERKREINWNTPLLVQSGGESLVLLQSPDELAALDAKTGTKRWSYAGGLSKIPSSVSGDGILLVPGEDLLALKLRKDQPPELLWSAKRLKPSTASPLVFQDRVYVLKSAGTVDCADAATGKVLGQERLAGAFSASPVIGDGRLYAVNEDGTTFVVELGDQPKVVARNVLKDTILASPVIADGAIFLRSDQRLYCIAEKRQP